MWGYVIAIILIVGLIVSAVLSIRKGTSTSEPSVVENTEPESSERDLIWSSEHGFFYDPNFNPSTDSVWSVFRDYFNLLYVDDLFDLDSIVCVLIYYKPSEVPTRSAPKKTILYYIKVLEELGYLRKIDASNFQKIDSVPEGTSFHQLKKEYFAHKSGVQK